MNKKAPRAKSRKKGRHITASSGRDDWRTPETILNLVRRVGPIACDPATSPDNPTRAEVFFTPETNGLAQDWPLVGLTFVNPPYGKELPRWSIRIALHAGEGLVVVPSRTETVWWNRFHLWCDWKVQWNSPWFGSRISFVDAETGYPALEGGSTFPSTVFYRGPRVRRFLEVFGPHGEPSPGPRELARMLAAASQAGILAELPGWDLQPSARDLVEPGLAMRALRKPLDKVV